MMKKAGRCILLLAAALAAGMAGGCGSREKNGGNMPGEMEFQGAEAVIELTFYNEDAKEDSWDDPVALALTKATGVKLKTDYPASASADRQVALMIAEQNYPDMIYAKESVGKLIEAGALIDLTELIEEYGPNIQKMYGEAIDRLRFSREDPSIYQLSAYAIGASFYKNSGTAQVQWALLKENDYRIPRTTAEYEEMVRNYLANHPFDAEGREMIGLTLSVTDWHWMITLGNPAGYIAEGAPDNGQWLIDADYNARYKFRSDKVRAYFKWLNWLYHEGILDQEFATQTHEDYIAKIASGRVVSLLDADWDYTDGESILISEGKLEQTYAGLPLTADESIKASSMMDQGLTVGQGVGITTACKDPVAAIRFIDYICSDEGQVLVNWGIQDVNYYLDEEGHRCYMGDASGEAVSGAGAGKGTAQAEVSGAESGKGAVQAEVSRAESGKRAAHMGALGAGAAGTESESAGGNSGIGVHGYPFPCYGDGVVDPTGSTYTPRSRELVIASYNEEQRKACEKWGVELLVDIFPQAEEFEVPKYSAAWAYVKSTEFNEISSQLDEIAWSGLISSVICSEAEFDACYDGMLAELEAAGMYRAEEMMTEMVKERAALAE